MPAAIRMANGYTYYPGGFNHAAREADWGGSSGNSLYGGSGRKLRTSPEDQYREYMLSQGYVENTSGIYPNWKFVRKDVLNKLNAMAAKQKAVDTVKGGAKAVGDAGKKAANAVGNAVGDAGRSIRRGVKQEHLNLRRAYTQGVGKYNQEHMNEDGTQGGNAFGRTMAGVGGAVKASKAYKVGKAAVGAAGKMLSTAGKGIVKGARAVGSGIMKGAGAVKDAVGNEIQRLVYGARNGRRRYGLTGGNAVGRTAAMVAGAIGNTTVGRAAKKAGRAVLNAGGTVVKKVGDALTSIKEFFGGAYTKVRGKVARAFNKGKDYDSAIGPEKKDKK